MTKSANKPFSKITLKRPAENSGRTVDRTERIKQLLEEKWDSNTKKTKQQLLNNLNKLGVDEQPQGKVSVAGQSAGNRLSGMEQELLEAGKL